MKKKKQGFTLAELLISITIMAIVTTMGLTIAKKSINNAYNEYFYNGYTTITNLLAEADHLEYTPGNKDFYDNIVKKYLTLRADDSTHTNTYKNFTTSSNINYILSGSNNITITMTVPQAKSKTSKDGKATVKLYYDKNITPYPIPISGYKTINIAERIDLLPCYIYDGEQGASSVCSDQVDKNGEPIYKSCTNSSSYKPKYMHLKQALCNTVNDATMRNKLNGCGSYSYKSDSQNMPIKFVRPSKAHH